MLPQFGTEAIGQEDLMKGGKSERGMLASAKSARADEAGFPAEEIEDTEDTEDNEDVCATCPVVAVTAETLDATDDSEDAGDADVSAAPWSGFSEDGTELASWFATRALLFFVAREAELDDAEEAAENDSLEMLSMSGGSSCALWCQTFGSSNFVNPSPANVTTRTPIIPPHNSATAP